MSKATWDWDLASGADAYRLPDRSEGSSYELWEHGQSGAVFAVRLDSARQITGCWGPLLSNQIRVAHLDGYPYDDNPRDLAWIERHRDNWEPAPLASLPYC